jgi:hypothetical protein
MRTGIACETGSTSNPDFVPTVSVEVGSTECETEPCSLDMFLAVEELDPESGHEVVGKLETASL